MNPSTPTRHKTQDTRHASAARDGTSRAALAQQLLVTKQLSELLPALEQRNIKSVLLKGTAFWTCIYEPGERPVSDIDILIRTTDTDLADEALRSLGYSGERNPLRPASEREYNNRHYYPHPKEHGLMLELHRRILHRQRYDIDTEGLFSRAIPCRIGSASALQLSVEDNLLHLAMHRTVHGDGFTPDCRNIEDAHRIIARMPVDWMALVDRAHAWGCATALWILLDSVRSRNDSAVPHGVLASLEPSIARRRYMDLVLESDHGMRLFRWPAMATWPRRLLLLPLILDHPRQHSRFVAYYAWLRVRDAWEARSP